MGQNIFVGILCIIAAGASIWGWWVDNGGSFRKYNEKNIKECEECNDEEN